MNTHINSFLDYLRYERNYSNYTVGAYSKDLQQFEDFVKEKKEGVFEPEEVDTDIVRNWIVYLLDNKIFAVSNIPIKTSPSLVVILHLQPRNSSHNFATSSRNIINRIKHNPRPRLVALIKMRSVRTVFRLSTSQASRIAHRTDKQQLLTLSRIYNPCGLYITSTQASLPPSCSIYKFCENLTE